MLEKPVREYRPELLPRSGETIAWALLLLTSLNLIVLKRWMNEIPAAAWLVWALLLFFAVSISLNNWVERHTRLRLDESGITFENGLRSVRLTWPEVQGVSRFPARWGQTVQVLGQKTGFVFHTLGEVYLQGRLRGKTGFAEGEKILEEIVVMSRLDKMTESNGVVYYSRR
jgi:hypothetical protein